MQLFIRVIHNPNPKDRQIIKTIMQTIQVTKGQETQANGKIQKTRQKIKNHDTGNQQECSELLHDTYKTLQ